MFAGLDRHEEAVVELYRAMDMQPDAAEPAYRLGHSLVELDRVEEQTLRLRVLRHRGVDDVEPIVENNGPAMTECPSCHSMMTRKKTAHGFVYLCSVCRGRAEMSPGPGGGGDPTFTPLFSWRHIRGGQRDPALEEVHELVDAVGIVELETDFP